MNGRQEESDQSEVKLMEKQLTIEGKPRIEWKARKMKENHGKKMESKEKMRENHWKMKGNQSIRKKTET